ncbi:MAG TPA: hypothetical protein PK609_00715, partial [Candidatus Paceibacterota bacterium]|nr:hypothetical protein [Candidatus Paceibacterota bacterium]
MSEGAPKIKQHSDLALEEAEARAEIRQADKGFFNRVFGKKDTGMGMLQEEALRMNTQIDAERERTSLSNTEAMDTVSVREEFDLVGIEEARKQEEFRIPNPELYDALKNHEYAKANELYRGEYKELGKSNDREALWELMDGYQDLLHAQIASSFKGGNSEAIRSAFESQAIAFTKEELLMIPPPVLEDPGIKSLATKEALDMLSSTDISELKGLAGTFVQSGLLESSSVDLPKIATERLKEEISLSHSIERLAERVKKFADTEILGSQETVTQLPQVQERATMLLKEEISLSHSIERLAERV